MQTERRLHVTPAGTVFTGEGTTTMAIEIEYRMERLLAQADNERLAAPRATLRLRFGRAIIGLGRAIGGRDLERAPRTASRPALHTR